MMLFIFVLIQLKVIRSHLKKKNAFAKASEKALRIKRDLVEEDVDADNADDDFDVGGAAGSACQEIDESKLLIHIIKSEGENVSMLLPFFLFLSFWFLSSGF